MQERGSAYDVEIIFKTIQNSYFSKNQGILTKAVRQFYRDPRYDNISPSDWRISISLKAYQNDTLSLIFYDIVKSMRDFKQLKAEKGSHYAFKTHLGTISLVMRLFQQSDEQWMYKPLRQFIRASKRIYLSAEKEYHESGSSGVTIKKDDLIYCLQRFKASRGIKQETKKQIMPLIDNLQVSIMLRYHNYDQIRRILEPKKAYGEHGPLFESNYYFQRGKVALINENMEQAEEYFEKIKIKTHSQKRLILRYLIPCKMFLGKMFIAKPNCDDEYFPEYQPIIEAIISADFNKYNEAIQRFQEVWIKRGIYLLMDRLRKIVWRNLIKRISKVKGSKMQMSDIQAGVKIRGGTQKIDECICIISNLIYEGYIKGYIYQNDGMRVLVLKKDGAFPKLATINK